MNWQDLLLAQQSTLGGLLGPRTGGYEDPNALTPATMDPTYGLLTTRDMTGQVRPGGAIESAWEDWKNLYDRALSGEVILPSTMQEGDLGRTYNVAGAGMAGTAIPKVPGEAFGAGPVNIFHRIPAFLRGLADNPPTRTLPTGETKVRLPQPGAIPRMMEGANISPGEIADVQAKAGMADISGNKPMTPEDMRAAADVIEGNYQPMKRGENSPSRWGGTQMPPTRPLMNDRELYSTLDREQLMKNRGVDDPRNSPDFDMVPEGHSFPRDTEYFVRTGDFNQEGIGKVAFAHAFQSDAKANLERTGHFVREKESAVKNWKQSLANMGPDANGGVRPYTDVIDEYLAWANDPAMAGSRQVEDPAAFRTAMENYLQGVREQERLDREGLSHTPEWTTARRQWINNENPYWRFSDWMQYDRPERLLMNNETGMVEPARRSTRSQLESDIKQGEQFVKLKGEEQTRRFGTSDEPKMPGMRDNTWVRQAMSQAVQDAVERDMDALFIPTPEAVRRYEHIQNRDKAGPIYGEAQRAMERFAQEYGTKYEPFNLGSRPAPPTPPPAPGTIPGLHDSMVADWHHVEQMMRNFGATDENVAELLAAITTDQPVSTILTNQAWRSAYLDSVRRGDPGNVPLAQQALNELATLRDRAMHVRFGNRSAQLGTQHIASPRTVETPGYLLHLPPAVRDLVRSRGLPSYLSLGGAALLTGHEMMDDDNPENLLR